MIDRKVQGTSQKIILLCDANDKYLIKDLYLNQTLEMITAYI